jgi:predicted transcriptional regulator
MNEIPYGKDVIINEQTREEFEEESAERLKKSMNGEDADVTVSFDTPLEIRKLLTEKRLELMKAIMNEKPESITELAEKLDRGIKEVHNDLKLLEENKIVFFEQKGRKKKPIIPYNDIKVDYSIKNSLADGAELEA